MKYAVLALSVAVAGGVYYLVWKESAKNDMKSARESIREAGAFGMGTQIFEDNLRKAAYDPRYFVDRSRFGTVHYS